MSNKYLASLLFVVILIGSAWVYWERHRSSRYHCVVCLRQIDGAKDLWAMENKKTIGSHVTWQDLVGSGKPIREMPICPQGGKYDIGKVGSRPSCNIPGHTLE
jgi:hypothetical protein